MQLDQLSGDIPLSAVYTQLESDINRTYTTDTRGSVSIQEDNHWRYGALGLIDEFVRDVLESDDLAFVPTSTMSARARYKPQKLGYFYFHRITACIQIGLLQRFDVRNVYVDLFLDACVELKILDWKSYVASQDIDVNRSIGVECFNRLVNTIRDKAKLPCFQNRIRNAKRELIRNSEECNEYVHALFKRHSRLVVLRIDLGYDKKCAVDVLTQSAKDDLKHLLNNRRSNKGLFGNLVGYIWKIEYGAERLLHFHVVMFFKKMDGRKDGYWAQRIGLYWKNVVTKGIGTFYNCNFSKDKYRRCGIGTIEHTDSEKIGNLLYAIQYFFKAEQCLPIKGIEGWRSFGKGNMPKARKSLVGRPRTECFQYL